MKFKIFIIGLLIIILSNAKSQDLGDPNCDSLLLVSSWFNDSVKIYDGCDGDFIRDLDSQSLLDGPQSIFEDKNGDVIVVSEQNHKLIKFPRQTLTGGVVVSGDDPNTTAVEPFLVRNPLAAVIDEDENLILGGYSQNEIIKVNMDTWLRTSTILPISTQYIRGLDIGMTIGPDGFLYVPGYDSDNIVKINLDTLVVTEVVASGGGGLNAPRAIVFHNNQMFVTGQLNHAVLRFDMNGNYIDDLTEISQPTGMIRDGDSHVLVPSQQLNSVFRVNLNTGVKETIIVNGASGLNGATFVYRLLKNPKQPETTANHHWLIGVGEIVDNRIDVETFSTTRGGVFGESFNPDEVSVIDWGSLIIEFTGCSTATMVYQSIEQEDGLEFGNGGYDLERLAINKAVQSCLENGFENIEGKDWMSGTMFGGESRTGEGFLLDVLNDTSVIVTWYSYLPM